MNTTKKIKSAFNYFGAKHRHLDFILPLLSPAEKNQHYVEPCCGSCSVFLNKKHDGLETLNDLDGRIYNFFDVLRNKPDELIYRLQLTPYSRNEFMHSLHQVKGDKIESARRFFVRCMQSYGAGAGDGTIRLTSWRTQFRESRQGVNLEVSKWYGKISGLLEIVERLRMASWDNRDMFEIFEKYDGDNTFFFWDTPYPHQSRTGTKDYRFELSDKQHKKLAEYLHASKSRNAVCGYDCKLLNDLYTDYGWMKHSGPSRSNNLGNRPTREIVWTNYEPANTQPTLFDN